MTTLLTTTFLMISVVAIANAKPAAKPTTKPAAVASPNSQKIDTNIHLCNTRFNDEAAKRGSKNEWVEQAPTVKNGKTFRTATKTLGTWLEATVDDLGKPALFEVTNKATTEITFGANCSPTTKITAGMDFKNLEPDKMATWYDDASLKADLEKKTSALVYVWSPEMVYSAKYYKYFRDVAKKMKLKFIPMLDPRTKLALVGKAEKEFAIPPSTLKMNSVELYMRNVTVHYPTSIVFDHGKIHDLPIVGVMEPDEIETQILARLTDLN
jgi:hypothetical protein